MDQHNDFECKLYYLDNLYSNRTHDGNWEVIRNNSEDKHTMADFRWLHIVKIGHMDSDSMGSRILRP